MTIDVSTLTLATAAHGIKSGALSPVALTKAYLERIKRFDGALNSVVLLTEDRALADADLAEREIAAGRYRGPLHGMPYGLKDIIDTAGIRTTCHSRIHLERVPSADATVAARLKAAGGVLVAKLATHEFATGGPAFDLPFPPARNPWRTTHFTGGSSSGSGAAVSAALLPFALGTDTGGSIRLPAAYCGIAGLKATYGRVSRRGVAPLSFSLDHVGPLAWTVEDCALALQILAGHDASDPGSADLPVPDYAAALGAGIAGLTIGYVRAFHANGADPEMADGLDAAMAAFERLGAKVIEVTLPPMRLFQACARAISGAEAFSVHEQDLRTRPELYARVTRERLMLGAYVTAADYVQAQRLRRELTALVDEALRGVDVLATAAILAPAPRLDDVETGPWRSNPPITTPFNITGHPALSLCCGFSKSGLPLALQLAGRAFDEATLLRAGHAYEQATPWRERRPLLPVASLQDAAQ
jgi:aspartyl-tRNA(Asn)/glutamyl-tRNA(Gln) amidotransferase subunit A